MFFLEHAQKPKHIKVFDIISKTMLVVDMNVLGNSFLKMFIN